MALDERCSAIQDTGSPGSVVASLAHLSSLEGQHVACLGLAKRSAEVAEVHIHSSQAPAVDRKRMGCAVEQVARSSLAVLEPAYGLAYQAGLAVPEAVERGQDHLERRYQP